MTKEEREQVKAIVENVRKIHDRIWELYHSEEPEREDYYERRREIRTKIKGKNVIDFGAACNQLCEVINLLENTICREITD